MLSSNFFLLGGGGGKGGGERSLNIFELDLKQASYVFKSRKKQMRASSVKTSSFIYNISTFQPILSGHKRLV